MHHPHISTVVIFRCHSYGYYRTAGGNKKCFSELLDPRAASIQFSKTTSLNAMSIESNHAEVAAW